MPCAVFAGHASLVKTSEILHHPNWVGGVARSSDDAILRASPKVVSDLLIYKIKLLILICRYRDTAITVLPFMAVEDYAVNL